MPTALVTGISGQDGSYLTELLLAKGYEVHGIVRRSSTVTRSRLDHIESEHFDQVHLHYGDLGDPLSMVRVIETAQPDEVYHLAAQSHVGISFLQPEYTGDVTGVGTMRLLEALRMAAGNGGGGARFYQASSSELYGSTPPPQSESTPFHPRSPYAVAKLYSYWATVNYRESYDMFASNGILFNHESPRRGENFVTRKITKGVADIVHGRASAAVFGFGIVASAQGYDPVLIVDPASPAPGGAYTVTYENCFVGDTITFTQADSTPTSVTDECEPVSGVVLTSVIALVAQGSALGVAVGEFDAAPTEAGVYDGTGAGVRSPSLPFQFEITVATDPTDPPTDPADPVTPTPEAPGGMIPDTGANGISTTTGIAIGLLVVGLGLFVVAQVRRRQAPTTI